MRRLKTVRETAEELGISRQAVYSKLTTNFKEKFTSIKKINNRDTLVISKAGIEALRVDTVKVDKPINNELIELMNKNIDTLQEQLKIKDSQIQELNERLKEQQELNRNNQILLHNQQDKNQVLELENQEHKEKRSFFTKFKGLFREEN